MKTPLMSPLIGHLCLSQSLAPKDPCKYTMYENHSRALKILVAMCVGLHNDRGDLIFAENKQPWKGMKVSTYRKNEILRCASQGVPSEDHNIATHPGHWSLTKVLQWLDDHPITNQIDREFKCDTLGNKREVQSWPRVRGSKKGMSTTKIGEVKSLICA